MFNLELLMEFEGGEYYVTASCEDGQDVEVSVLPMQGEVLSDEVMVAAEFAIVEALYEGEIVNLH